MRIVSFIVTVLLCWGIFSSQPVPVAAQNAEVQQELDEQEIPMMVADPAWKPDSQYLAFVWNREPDERDSLCLWNRQTERHRCILEGWQMSTPSWSRNGERLAISVSGTPEGKTDIWIINIDDLELTQVTRTTQYNEWSPVWSTNSRRIYFNTDRRGIRTDVWSTCLTSSCTPAEEIRSGEVLEMTEDGLMYYQRPSGDIEAGVYINGDSDPVYEDTNFPRLYSRSWDGEQTIRVIRRSGACFAVVTGVEDFTRHQLAGCIVSQIAMSPDGTAFAYELEDGRIAVVRFPTSIP
jgi:hypothetical protein